MEHPKAQGLKWRPRVRGPAIPYWVASRAAIEAGYPTKSARLSGYATEAEMLARCDRLNGEMLAWLNDKRDGKSPFDGTWGSLIRLYQTDDTSTFKTLKPGSLHPYTVYARKLISHIGELRISECDGRDVKRWFDVWKGDGKPKIAAARTALCVLKAAISFGITARYIGCADFQVILEQMQFENTKPRQWAPDAAVIDAARKAAHANGRPARALCYALQFETTARQWDFIGQWIPLSDPRPSLIIGHGMKWIGPMWSDISEKRILKITPSKTDDTTAATVTFDLTACPMVMEEIAKAKRRKGPLIVNEATGLPYRAGTFTLGWREDADLAELPRGLWNRDIRAGGNTEGQIAGAPREDRRIVMGHASDKMTATVYDRDTLEAHRRTAAARTQYRANNPKT